MYIVIPYFVQYSGRMWIRTKFSFPLIHIHVPYWKPGYRNNLGMFFITLQPLGSCSACAHS